MQDGKHAVLNVEVNGVRHQMLQHSPGARLCTQTVGLSASSQQIAQCVVIRYHTFKQKRCRILSECWRMVCPWGDGMISVHKLIKYKCRHDYKPIMHTTSWKLSFHYTLISDRLQSSLRRFGGASSKLKSFEPILAAESSIALYLAASACKASIVDLSAFEVFPLLLLIWVCSDATYTVKYSWIMAEFVCRWPHADK